MSAQKPSSTVGIQAGHSREATLMDAEVSAREQKLASALGKQKQLTLQVRTEHKKRAATWAAERAELQAMVLSLQGRNAELEKVQRMVLGNPSAGLHGWRSGPAQPGCHMVGPAAAACSLTFPVAGTFPGFPCPANAAGTEERATGGRRVPELIVDRVEKGNEVLQLSSVGERRQEVSARQEGNAASWNAQTEPDKEVPDCVAALVTAPEETNTPCVEDDSERLSRTAFKQESDADGEDTIAVKLRNLCADANQKLEEQRQELEKQLSEQLAALEDAEGNAADEEKKATNEQSMCRGELKSRESNEEDAREEGTQGKYKKYIASCSGFAPLR